MYLIRMAGGGQTPALVCYLTNTCDGGEDAEAGNTNNCKQKMLVGEILKDAFEIRI
jgi:hypothetical protein